MGSEFGFVCWSTFVFTIWVCNIVVLTSEFTQWVQHGTTEINYKCVVSTWFDGSYVEYAPQDDADQERLDSINPCCRTAEAKNCYDQEWRPSTQCCEFDDPVPNLWWTTTIMMGMSSFALMLLMIKAFIDASTCGGSNEECATMPRLDCMARLVFLGGVAFFGVLLVLSMHYMYEDNGVLHMPSSRYGMEWEGDYKEKKKGAYNSLWCMTICYFLIVTPALLAELYKASWDPPDTCTGCCDDSEAWKTFRCEPCQLMFGCLMPKGK